MQQLDIYISLLLIGSIALGTYRGFSGELGSLLKLVLTIVISYKVLGMINEKLNFSFIQNIFFPMTIYSVVYILTSFILKIIIFQMVFMLRSIIPSVVDKPLGAILGFIKTILILIMIYIVAATTIFTLKIDTPKWLGGTKTESHLITLSIKFLNLIPNIEFDEDNIGDNSLLSSMISASANSKKGKSIIPNAENILNNSSNKSDQLQGLYNILKEQKNLQKIIPGEVDSDSMDLDSLIEELEKN